MGELKNHFRKKMNEVIAYPDSLVRQYLKKISEDYKLPLPSLYLYSMQELEMVPSGFCLPEEDLRQRSETYAMYYDQKGYHYIAGDKAMEAIEGVHKEPVASTMLEGTPATAGTVTATARVLHYSLEDIGKTETLISSMQEGEILVAETTGPEIVEACNKAVAIVTDEGGLLSHAAIVSRELQIPCVVGTKFATTMIRTGDTITVDGDAGVVKILKKRK